MFFRRKKPECPHVEQMVDVQPNTPEGCEECLQSGGTWVHLRVCLVCGHVGCCDNSPNTHATKHYHATQHAIIQSYEPDEAWRYCYPDDKMLSDAETSFR